MRPEHVEIFSVMPNLVDLGGVGVDVALGVTDDRVLLPTLLPQLVHDFHVFVGAVVAFVVRKYLAQSILLGVGQVRGDDVPSHASLGQMVERGEEFRGLVWRMVGRAVGGGEAADGASPSRAPG